MSESLEGVRVAATRQNSGTVRYGSGRPAGGVNAPAATTCATVILACGSASDARPSQDAANAADLHNSVTTIAIVFTEPPVAARLSNRTGRVKSNAYPSLTSGSARSGPSVAGTPPPTPSTSTS